VVWVDESISLRRDSEGKPLYLITSVLDITDRKQSELALIESETRLKTVLDTTADGIVLVDSKTTRFSFANRAFCDMLGYRPEEVSALGLREIHPAEKLAEIRESLERNLRGEIRGTSDIPLVRKNGSVFFADVSGSPTILGGQPQMVGCFHDVTERKVAADALAYRDLILHAVTIGAAELIKQESIETAMSRALMIVGEAVGVDRVLVVENAPGVPVPSILRYAWRTAGLSNSMEQTTLAAGTPDDPKARGVWLAPLANGKPVIAHTRTAEGPIRRHLESLQNQSVLLMPITVGGRFWGAIGIDACKSEREWTPTEIDVLGTFAEIIGMVILRNDTQLSLRKSEERFRAVSETALDAIIITDRDARVCFWNRAAQRMFGYSADEAMGRPIFDWLLAPQWSAKVLQDLRQPVAPAEDGYTGNTMEVSAIRKDGIRIPVEIATNTMTIGPERYALGILRDITERKRAEKKMVNMARTDRLTGLANRDVFAEMLDREILRVKQKDAQGFAVLYLDLDHFKDVNDTLGHPVGDILLIAVAARICANVRSMDLVARFGGDEFAVAVTDIRDPMEAAAVADSIAKAISEPFIIEGNAIRSSASVGIAVFGKDSPNAVELLSHADIALYRAKSEARGIYRFFTEAMDAELRERVTLGSELHQAIDLNQFFLMYQPQVDSDTGRIVGLEALVRWQHPRRGVVGPGQFIPEMERSGLIVALGHWVIREACRQAKQWLDAGIALPLIGVNVSGVQFRTSVELEDDIVAILAEFGLPPKRLELEFTESVLMEVSQERNDVLLRLRRMGLQTAIDDFGSGYSSLDYLRRYPADRIKIAQTFIQDIGIKPENDSIVRAAIGLAHELGMKVIVEGVETGEQLRLVRAWGGRIIQGFCFARPLGAIDATALLRSGKIAPVSVGVTEVPIPFVDELRILDKKMKPENRMPAFPILG
jgi:diguanylate cyclase (GGDEF)-like protein/PAS domain S-box-containing protein